VISAWGIEDGVVQKAAWKAFYPAPPKVSKIPRRKLKITSGKDILGVDKHTARTLRGRPAGSLTVDPDNNTVMMARTTAGFRRKGVASHLLGHAEKQSGSKVAHSPHRTTYGNAWAKATDKKRGAKPPPVSELYTPKKKGVYVEDTTRKGSRRMLSTAAVTRSGVERGKKKVRSPMQRAMSWNS
jgi:hypothetical protein